MPKGKPKQKFGKQNLVDDELDAYDYAEEDAGYQRWEETQVKEGKEIPKEEKPKDQKDTKVLKEPKPQLKEEKPALEVPPVEPPAEEEIELEQFDDWEQAMDALEAKVSQEEAKKAAQRVNLNTNRAPK